MSEQFIPVHLDVEVASKADYRLEWQLTDEDGDELDISTESVMLIVYRNRIDTTPLIEKTNAPGEHSTPTEGKTAFDFTPDDSAWMEKREELALYEIWRVYESGMKRFPWFRGGMLFRAMRGID